MRHRTKMNDRKSKRLFTNTAYPVKMNKRKVTGKGIKRGGTRL